MIEIKAYELQKLINTCYEAVDKSNVGPLFIKTIDGTKVVDPNGCPMSSYVACQTFLAIVNALVPKDFTMGVEDRSKEKENKDETKK